MTSSTTPVFAPRPRSGWVYVVCLVIALAGTAATAAPARGATARRTTGRSVRSAASAKARTRRVVTTASADERSHTARKAHRAEAAPAKPSPSSLARRAYVEGRLALLALALGLLLLAATPLSLLPGRRLVSIGVRVRPSLAAIGMSLLGADVILYLVGTGAA